VGTALSAALSVVGIRLQTHGLIAKSKIVLIETISYETIIKGGGRIKQGLGRT
jgi:hypothetical protein